MLQPARFTSPRRGEVNVNAFISGRMLLQPGQYVRGVLIRREDRMLHHPFQTFTPIVDLLKKAAHDPDVLAIKMTLYRVGRNSPIVGALLEAIARHTGARVGKR